jgi:two-component system KDP operon response regulator KdpE
MDEGDKSRKILLVDDAPDDVEMYSSYLDRLGYKVAIAMDGAAAVDLALREHFDLAIIDIGLPKLDGIGVMMVLRNYTKTRRMPIVSLSARTGPETRAAALDAGANMAVEKPCTPEELQQVVEALLHRRD